MNKILLIEDDENLGPSIQTFLRDENFDVALVNTLAKARSENFSDYGLLILDWMLPDGQGIDLLRDLREKKIKIPIIMLTAKSDLIDKVVGLESGANDYLTKPFEPRELIARIRVQLRNLVVEKSNSILTFGDLVVNREKREVFFKKKKIEMTKMEFDLLALLVESPGKSFSREELLNKVWGFENYPTTRTVDTHVLQLRQKLADDLIETVWGVGYKIKEIGLKV